MKKCEADVQQAAAFTCETQAASRKLAGAAKTSFLKKCEADATAASGATACEAQANTRKLAGAAKTSFVKKCVADAKG
ncbi:hypothetical protein WG922_07900 [Ramlibacter sp. AN1015]|uniref:hypothetical protein n=1 Tax=Ramlibacter sp. AN1015 TaxID=3133428 RepID=UPI0030BC4CAA